MVGMFMIGTIFALSHHLYYLSLDGTTAASMRKQQHALQVGTLFALLSKTCLAGCIAVAQLQWAWWTSSQKPISLRGLDAIFGVLKNVFKLGNLEMIKKAKMASLLALFVW
jgi:hypothetical protein